MELSDIKDGDLVRLRNGETIRVDSRSTKYTDRDGEHEGPFVNVRGGGFDHYLLSDVVEVVERNSRLCRFCGEGVTSTNAEVDFCRGCHYTGRAHEERQEEVIAKILAVPSVETCDVWHTGGGCFLLAATLKDGRLLTMDSDLALPENGEPWTLLVVSPDEEAWSDWDEERLDVRNGSWTNDQLAAEVAAIAEAPATNVVAVDFPGESQYREELQCGRDPRD